MQKIYFLIILFYILRHHIVQYLTDKGHFQLKKDLMTIFCS